MPESYIDGVIDLILWAGNFANSHASRGAGVSSVVCPRWKLWVWPTVPCLLEALWGSGGAYTVTEGMPSCAAAPARLLSWMRLD